MATISRFQFFRFGKDEWDPTHRFETSWLLPPWVLFGFRAAFALYAFTTLFVIIGYEAHNPLYGTFAIDRSFSYFTVLSYWGLSFYFLTSAIHTLLYLLTSRSPILTLLPRPLLSLHALFQTSILIYPLLVTLTFWAIIHCTTCLSTPFKAYQNISQHALNSVFALFELFITRTIPPLWIHLLWLEVGLAAYLAVAYITSVTQGWYSYEFLDPRGGKAGRVTGYVVGVAIACAVIFSVVKGAVWGRLWVTERRWGMEGKFAGGRRRGSVGPGVLLESVLVEEK